MLQHAQHGEAATSAHNLFLLFKEVAFYVEQKSGNGVGVFVAVVKFVFINSGDLAEVAKQSLSVKNESVVGEFGVGFLLVVILVVDVAYNLLEHVLKGGNTLGAAIFIDYHRHVYLLFAEIFKEVVDHACFRHEISRSDEALPAE